MGETSVDWNQPREHLALHLDGDYPSYIQVDPMARISDLAVFVAKADEPIKVSANCVVRSGCTIYYGTVLEPSVQLGHDVFIRERCRIGKGTKVGTKSLIEWSSQIGEWCMIEGNCFISEGTEIGDHSFLGPQVRTTSDDHMEPLSPSYTYDAKARRVALTPVRIGSYVKIGAGVSLLPGVRVGDHSKIGAGCVIVEDVQPYSLMIARGVKGEYVRNTVD